MASQDHQDQQVLRVRVVNLEAWVLKGLQEIEVVRVPGDLQGSQEALDLRVSLVWRDGLDLQDHQDPRDLQETP